MSKKAEKKEPHIIYKKDLDLSKTGFTVFEDAQAAELLLKKKFPEPGHRVRNRLRSRTNTWDVVVKVRTEVHDEPKPAPQQEVAA